MLRGAAVKFNPTSLLILKKFFCFVKSLFSLRVLSHTLSAHQPIMRVKGNALVFPGREREKLVFLDLKSFVPIILSMKRMIFESLKSLNIRVLSV